MITFETHADFEAAVMECILEKISLRVWTKGHPFVTGVEVAVVERESGSILFSDSDAVA